MKVRRYPLRTKKGRDGQRTLSFGLPHFSAALDPPLIVKPPLLFAVGDDFSDDVRPETVAAKRLLESFGMARLAREMSERVPNAPLYLQLAKPLEEALFRKRADIAKRHDRAAHDFYRLAVDENPGSFRKPGRSVRERAIVKASLEGYLSVQGRRTAPKRRRAPNPSCSHRQAAPMGWALAAVQAHTESQRSHTESSSPFCHCPKSAYKLLGDPKRAARRSIEIA